MSAVRLREGVGEVIGTRSVRGGGDGFRGRSGESSHGNSGSLVYLDYPVYTGSLSRKLYLLILMKKAAWSFLRE